MAFTVKQIFWGSLFLLVMLPPDAHPSTSDGLPWSQSALSDRPGVKRDSLGALRDANMSSDGQHQNPSLNRIAVESNDAKAPVEQKNADTAQSGPAAAGLFTPSSPGNAAALAAQLRGSLAGAPIVDGHGANLTITVPMMTPSQNPDYEPGSNLDSVSGAAVSAPTSAGPGVNTVYSARTESSIDTVSGAVAKPMIQAFRQGHLPRRTIVLSRDRQTVFATNRAARDRDRDRDPGPVSGFISYGNGDTTVFAANGIINIYPRAAASLTFNDGRSIRISPDSARRLTQNLYTSL